MIGIDDLQWVDEILIELEQNGKLNLMEWGRLTISLYDGESDAETH